MPRKAPQRGYRLINKKLGAVIFSLLLIFNVFAFTSIVSAEDNPDLEISTIEILSPSGTIHKNDQVDLKVKVKNSGSAPVNSGTTITVVLKIDTSQTIADSTTISNGVSAGSSRFVYLTWDQALLGTHSLNFNVDYDENVTESDENNNWKTIYVSVEERKTDLAVVEDTIRTYPESVYENETALVCANVTNLGKDVEESVNVRLYIDDDLFDTKTIDKSNLQEGETVNVSFTWNLLDVGDHVLNFSVDPVSGETSTGNNYKEKVITVLKTGVKLEVIGNNEASVGADETKAYQLRITNTGTVSDSFNISTKKTSGNNWDISVSQDYFELNAEQSDTFYVDITSPGDAEAGDESVVKVIANSTSHKSASVLLTTNVTTNLSVESISLAHNAKLCYTDKNANVDVKITNMGANVTEVGVHFYVNDELTNDTTISMSAPATKNLVFEWQVESTGLHELKVVVDENNDVFEINESDNSRLTEVFSINKPTWWNHTWHYRMPFALIGGTGNASYTFNFTHYLSYLGIEPPCKEFDNNSIRVIQYYANGTVKRRVDHNFEKAAGWLPASNAVGTLTWEVRGSKSTKYYAIYWDYTPNDAIGGPKEEVEASLTQQGVFSKYRGLAEGWWMEFTKPEQNISYRLSETIDISVKTKATAETVSVDVKREGELQETIQLTPSNNNTKWTFSDYPLNKTGEWTLIATGEDWVGYTNTTILTFNVGKPDLAVSSVSLKPSTIYEPDMVTINASVISHNISVDNVNVSLFINNQWKDQKDIPLGIDEADYVTFDWKPSGPGTYDISVWINKNKVIPEKSGAYGNNVKTIVDKQIIGVPDIEVTNITLTPMPVEEGEPVNIRAFLRNIGNATAEEYEIALYLATAEDQMSWNTSEIQDNATIDEIPDDGEEYYIDLTWSQAEYGSNGEWIVGVQVKTDAQNRDLDTSNNRGSKTFSVKRGELIKPTFSGIDANPDPAEQGQTVTLSVVIEDESGLSEVGVNITDPDNTVYDWTISEDNIIQDGSTYTVSYTFRDTEVNGSYSFYFYATDKSYNENYAKSLTSSFTIEQDTTAPDIQVTVSPQVLLVEEDEITVTADISDQLGVNPDSVTAEFTVPTSPPHSDPHDMIYNSTTNKYVCTSNFSIIGKYTVKVTAEDKEGNPGESGTYEFWVTVDLYDTDSDGMPDEWEEKHGFDPEYPGDAVGDPDQDTYTNLEEYNQGTDPHSPNYLFYIIQHLTTNWQYLLLSIILFILLMILCTYGIWRNKP